MPDPAITDPAAADFPEGVAVVIGGSGGVGGAICQALARSGSDIVLTYRNNEGKAAAVARLVEAAGRRAEAYALAAEHEQEVEAFFAAVVARHGRIHTVINAAGSDIPMVYINQLSPDTWREVMHNDANGFFNIVHHSLPQLRQHGGSYVTISTTGLHRWPTRDVLSVAPKAAIDALITGIAREEGRCGVRANTVALGLIDTGLFQRLRGSAYSEEYMDAAIRNSALKRLGTAEEVADAVVFFASDRARFITGQTLVLDGGYSL